MFHVVFTQMILLKGIVRMEVLDNLDIYSEDAREAGNIDDFNPKLIPLKSNSYLGQFLLSWILVNGQANVKIKM